MRGGYAERKRSNRAKNARVVWQRPANFGIHEYIGRAKNDGELRAASILHRTMRADRAHVGMANLWNISNCQRACTSAVTAKVARQTADVQCTLVHIIGGGQL